MTETKLERQLKLELRANEYSYERLMRQISNRIGSNKADELLEGRMILLHGIDALASKLTEYFETPKLHGKRGLVRTMLASEFSDAPKDLAYIILVTLVRYISQDTMVPVSHMVRVLNKNIHDSILVRRLDKSANNLSSYIDKRYKHRGDDFRAKEKMKIIKRQEEMNDPTLTDVTAYLGGVLIDIVVKSGINIIELRTIRQNEKTTQYIVYTEECYRMVLQSRDILLEEYRKYPIFLIQPVDWTGFKGSGGYYNSEVYKLSMVKTRPEARNILSRYFEKNDVSTLTRVLNTLQKTPWRVNKRVYNVMQYIFSNNIMDPEYPHHNPRLIGGLPYNGAMEPEDYINIHNYGELHADGPYKGKPKEKDMIRKYHKDIEDQRDICLSNNGKAIMHNLIMNNAREYLDEDEFYFSYQFDFRGRIYPIQQHLQPQGSGKIKALLEFATGSRITTDEQRKWFLIHGANTYGFDKLPYDERVTRIMEMHNDILDVADDPLKYRNLWNGADDPYMFLAWAFEYADYVMDGDNFMSHIPIALDATCSGIQLYSGLLKDADGARSVNVIGDTREDIYQNVADKVNEYLRTGQYAKSFAYTNKAGEELVYDAVPLADSLRGKITRSLVKRNVMTQPYSVTKRGMYEQLIGELKELENNNKKFWVGDLWAVAKFLADLNENAITEVVKGAKVGQQYLKDVTRDLVSRGEYVAYKAPLTAFPVVQKISKRASDRVQTPIGRITIRRPSEGLDKMKMSNGIAPNYIHSLDAALLATTVLKLADAGCSNFHMIHDSYGVPIGHIHNLNTMVRETFVELFSCDPLKRFVDTVNPNYDVGADEVMINTLDLAEVVDSKYIFS